MRSLTNKANIMLAIVAAMFLAMFMLADTAWGLTYQEGDVWIGTDGEVMTPFEASAWEYELTSDDPYAHSYTNTFISDNGLEALQEGVTLTQFSSYVFDESNDLVSLIDEAGKLTVPVPAIINGQNVTHMHSTFFSRFGNTDLKETPMLPDTIICMNKTFEDCYELTHVTNIPNSVIALEETFSGCKKLNDVPELPNSVLYMPYTFLKCESLDSFAKLPNEVKLLFGTFQETNIKRTPEIPNSVTKLEYTFNSCKNLTSISKISDSVVDLTNTFSNCTNLEYPPILPQNAKVLYSTFEGCTSLKTFPLIPNTVTNMKRTFYDCTSISGDIYIEQSNPGYGSTFENTTNQIRLLHLHIENGGIPACHYASNISPTLESNVELVCLSEPPVIDPGTGDDQTTTTPSNPGETEGNLSIYGTVNPINMIDVTVPLTIEFIIESDRTFTGPDDINIVSNCPSPLDVLLYGVNKSEEAPTLVAPTTYDDNGWNNLSRADTRAKMALMLSGTSLTDTSATLGRINSAFVSEQSLSLDLTAKYGKAWDNSEDHVFTYNVVFEFAMP